MIKSNENINFECRWNEFKGFTFVIVLDLLNAGAKTGSQGHRGKWEILVLSPLGLALLRSLCSAREKVVVFSETFLCFTVDAFYLS